MARASAKGPAGEGSASLEERAEILIGLMADLCLAALPFVSQTKVDETARQWLASERIAEDEAWAAEAVADALPLALDVALFAPSAAGTTAIDRFARQHRPDGPVEREALAVLRRAAFRILRVEEPDPQGGLRLLDLATGDTLRLLDPSFPVGCEGLAIAARVASLEGDAVVTIGPITPLDDAALEVARARMRPGGKGLTNPNRCAEAIYRHVVRFGGATDRRPQSPARGRARRFPLSPEDGPSTRWPSPGQRRRPTPSPRPARSRRCGSMSGERSLIEALAGCIAARAIEDAALAAAYEHILTLQIETIERRAAIGHVGCPGRARARRRGASPGGRRRRGGSADGGALPGGRGSGPGPPASGAEVGPPATISRRSWPASRRSAPRRSTAAAPRRRRSLRPARWRSCSTATASRWARSSSRSRAARASASRRAAGASVRSTAASRPWVRFCDCRVWSEKAPDGEIRYVFFGLPADVAGARYLYELVERAFATETDLFRRSELYADHGSRDRRSATQSFQTGLAHGIARKLDELQRQRDEATRTDAGRDLVPIKEGVIEAELAKLGLRFHSRGGGRGRYLLRDAYEAGHEAGERFEHRPGIETPD